MTPKRRNYILLCISLFLCGAMFLDAFFIPSKKNDEVVIELTEKRNGTYSIKTNDDNYRIGYDLYSALSIGKKITVLRSMLTGANQKIEVPFPNQVDSYNICYASQPIGIISLSFISILTIIFMFFYEGVKYKPGRDKLTLFILLLTFAIFYFHVY